MLVEPGTQIEPPREGIHVGSGSRVGESVFVGSGGVVIAVSVGGSSVGVVVVVGSQSFPVTIPKMSLSKLQVGIVVVSVVGGGVTMTLSLVVGPVG